MPQTAYDLSVFENRPQAKKQQPLRVAKGNRTGMVWVVLRQVRMVAVGGILLALLCSYLFSQAQVSALAADIQKYESQLAAAQSEYSYLTSQMDAITNQSNVDGIAAKLGLMKIDPSQVTYITVEQESQITRPDSGLNKIARQIGEMALSILNYLNP